MWLSSFLHSHTYSLPIKPSFLHLVYTYSASFDVKAFLQDILTQCDLLSKGWDYYYCIILDLLYWDVWHCRFNYCDILLPVFRLHHPLLVLLHADGNNLYTWGVIFPYARLCLQKCPSQDILFKLPSCLQLKHLSLFSRLAWCNSGSCGKGSRLTSEPWLPSITSIYIINWSSIWPFWNCCTH